jgi:hypothetical protein
VAADLGADAVSLRNGRLTVGPLALGSAHVRELKERWPQAVYAVSSREVSARLKPAQPGAKLTMRQGLEVLDAIVESRRASAA